MKEYHVIMGNGNLGTALATMFNAKSIPFGIHHRSSIEDITWSANNLASDEGYDVFVWNTEGYGSVPECASSPESAFKTHFWRNLELMVDLLPSVTLINFSTNYVGENPKSVYASSKECMETLTTSFPKKKVVTIRVANLYSKYFPMKSFQGKILKNKDSITALPRNGMIPTDCDWLADHIHGTLFVLDHHDYDEDYGNNGSLKLERYHSKIISVAPKGLPSARQVGEIVLGKDLEENVDWSRPMYPTLSTIWDDTETWEEVWEKAKPEFIDSYNKEIMNK